MAELKMIDNRLSLVNDEGLSIAVDFVEGKLAHRRQFPGKENLKKTLNLKVNPKPFVVDATAGLGRDAAMIAHFGCEVLMLEQSTEVCELLRDGLERAKSEDPECVAGLSLERGDAKIVLKDLAPDIVYLDPMFPERKKSAKVKKDMQILQELELSLGDDLLPIALAVAKDRVIVKRPRLAPCLNEQKPSYSLEGRSTRFDVYMV